MTDLRSQTEQVTPQPPRDAQFFFSDSVGRPCSAEEAVLWTWEHSDRWFRVSEFPIPGIGAKKKPRRADNKSLPDPVAVTLY
jgi:hypothetical protein